MKFRVTLGSQPPRSFGVELRRAGDAWECTVDGVSRTVDVAEVAPGLLSLLLDGQSFAVWIERLPGQAGLPRQVGVGETYRVHTRGADLVAAVEDPRRWAGRSRGALGLTGRQQIAAPMPGKVVRVLVAENQPVEAGQGLVVVEAMKMQNEIPAPKRGVVEKVLVREGDTVEHGQTLLVVA